jgi:hypothetical protein
MMQACSAGFKEEVMTTAPAEDAGSGSTTAPATSGTATSTTETTTTNADGSTTTTTTTTNSDGSTSTQSVTKDANGGVVSTTNSTTTTDANGTTTWTSTSSADGSSSVSVSKTSSDGTNVTTTNSRDANGNDTSSKIIRTADGKVYTKDKNGYWHKYTPKQCIDESCQSCQRNAENFPKTQQDCAISGGSSAACQRYQGALSCCGGKKPGFLVDPTTIMPTPDGDYMCTATPSSTEMRTEMCKEHCKIASNPGDCEAACAQNQRTLEVPSMLDRICQYAYSEDCFQSSDIPMPATPGGSGGSGVPSPRPDPALKNPLIRHLMLPPRG